MFVFDFCVLACLFRVVSLDGSSSDYASNTYNNEFAVVAQPRLESSIVMTASLIRCCGLTQTKTS